MSISTLESLRTLARAKKIRGNVADHFRSAGTFRIGLGLYLRVKVSKRDKALLKTWLHRYDFDGLPRWDSLGNAYAVTDVDAAHFVDAAREVLLKGHDPRGTRTAAVTRPGSVIRFKACAEGWLEQKYGVPSAALLSAETGKHVRQVFDTVEATYPVLGNLAIDQVDQNHIAGALKVDWMRVPATASRVRGRLENILDWAISRKDRTEAFNPANAKTIVKILFDNSDAKEKESHAALEWRSMPEFIRELNGESSMAAIALRVVLRTTKRSAEVLKMRWEHLYLDRAVWAIPRRNMKVKKGRGKDPHLVPLTAGLVALLRDLKELGLSGAWVFPGRKNGPLSHSAMHDLLKRMGYGPADKDSGEVAGASGEVICKDGSRRKHFTVHGFRTAFREWARFTKVALPPSGVSQRELAELQLDHKFFSDTEGSYARDQLFDLRAPLMQAWEDYIEGKTPAASSGTLRLVA